MIKKYSLLIDEVNHLTVFNRFWTTNIPGVETNGLESVEMS